LPVWKAFPVMPWMRSTEVRFGEGCAIRRNAGPFQMHVASGSWFRGSTSGWAACCHVDHGRFTLKADIATLPRYVRSVPCVDGSELARLFFTFAGWSVQPCVRPVRAVHMTAGHNAFRGSGPGQKPAFEMHRHKWVVLIAGSTGSALRAVGPPNLHITP